MVTVPQFTMGGHIRDDWMQGAEGISNALGQYHQRGLQNRKIEQDQRQFQVANALARERLAQDASQFGMTNALAARSADRADELAPGQLEMQQAQIAHALSQARSEREMRPLIMDLKRTELQLMKAKAEGRDDETLRFKKLFDDPPQPQAAPPPQQQPGYTLGVRPQSFQGVPPQPMAPMPDVRPQIFQGVPPQPMAPMPGVRPQIFQGVPPQPMAPMPVVDTAGARNPLAPQQDDASLILTQGAAPQAPPQPQAQPNAQPSVRDIVKNMTPAQQAQLWMSWTGKGDAAKVIGEAANGQQLGKEARNDIDKKELAAVQTLARVKEIERSYKPEYVTNEGKFKQYAISWVDSFDATRKRLPPDVVRDHGDFVEFRRNAVSVVNQHIKDMTGSAMGVEEAKRLMEEVADAKNDSPISFERKIKSMARDSEMAVGRMRMLRRDGFQGQPWNGTAEQAAANLPLPKFQRMIEGDTRRLYQELREQNPDAADAQIKGAVRQSIRTKYGIDS